MFVTSQLTIQTTKIIVIYLHLCPPHFEKRSATHGTVCWKGNFSTAHNMLDIKFDSYVVHAIQLIQKVDYTYFL